MMSQDLRDADIQLLNSLIPAKSKIQVGRIGKLYKSAGTSFIPISVGVFCGEKDNKSKSYFIRFYDLKRRRLEFEQEIYREMQYLTPNEKFHICQGTNFPFGIGFIKREDGQYLEDFVRKTVQFSMKQPSQPAQPAAPMVTSPVRTPVVTTGKKTVLGKKGKITAADIGQPINFKHIEHFDIDPNKNFNKLNSPETKELQEKLKELGFGNVITTDMDACFALNFIQKHGGIDALKVSGKSAISGPIPIDDRAKNATQNKAPVSAPQVPSANRQSSVPVAPPPPPAKSTSSIPPPPPIANFKKPAGTPSSSNYSARPPPPPQNTAPRTLPAAPLSLQEQIQGFSKDALKKTVPGSRVTSNEPVGGGINLANQLVAELNRRRDIMDAGESLDSDTDNDWE